jgi:NAD(P)-dependent dehydrogenase (short-subunit alcohol dehydrogenase family)
VAENCTNNDFSRWTDKFLCGTPEQVIGKMTELRQVGLDYFVVTFADLPATDTMEKFAAAIMPLFNDSPVVGYDNSLASPVPTARSWICPTLVSAADASSRCTSTRAVNGPANTSETILVAMQLNLSGKRALVVGASKGLGKVTARALIDEGAVVSCVARNPEILAETVTEIAGSSDSARAFPADFTSAAAVAAVVKQAADWMSGVDILVNCAGLNYVRQASILDITDDTWQAAFDVCVLATVRASTAAVPIMLAGGGGSIINISALSARWHRPYCAQYGAMQLAKENYSRCLAKEMATKGIRVNVVNAGMMRSEKVYELMAHALESEGMGDDITDTNITAQTPQDLKRQVAIKENIDLRRAEQALLKLREGGAMFWSDRFANSEEVADVILYLASDRAAFVNGAIWMVDGGGSYGPP